MATRLFCVLGELARWYPDLQGYSIVVISLRFLIVAPTKYVTSVGGRCSYTSDFPDQRNGTALTALILCEFVSIF